MDPAVPSEDVVLGTIIQYVPGGIYIYRYISICTCIYIYIHVKWCSPKTSPFSAVFQLNGNCVDCIPPFRIFQNCPIFRIQWSSLLLLKLSPFRLKPLYLVGGLNHPEKYESQLGILLLIYGKIKNVWNHQPNIFGLYSYFPKVLWNQLVSAASLPPMTYPLVNVAR